MVNHMKGFYNDAGFTFCYTTLSLRGPFPIRIRVST